MSGARRSDDLPRDCITVIGRAPAGFRGLFETPADSGGIRRRAVQLEVGNAMQTDQDLIARLREGDPSPALAELYRRHGRMVERTVLRRVRDEHLAQDVCQAVFWILLQKAESLKDRDEIGGWLH